MKVARTVWTYTKTIRLVRDGIKLVSATAGDIDGVNGTIKVPANKVNHPVEDVVITFNKEVTITKVTPAGALDNIKVKFGTDKGVTFTAAVASTFANLAAEETEAVVTVKDADGLEKEFTIKLELEELTVKNISGVVVYDSSLELWEVSVSFDTAKKIFPGISTTDKVELELAGGETYEFIYNAGSETQEPEFVILTIPGGSTTKGALEAAVVTVK